MTAFGPNPDGVGTLLRVWEQSGTSSSLTVTLPAGFVSALPVTLRGEPKGTPLPVTNNQLTLDLGPYAPASFVLTSRLGKP